MMKWFTGMGYQKTLPAEQGLCKAVDTTERGIGCRANNTFRKTRQQRGGLQPNVLVQEYICTLNPLFQQCLFVGLGLWWRGNS